MWSDGEPLTADDVVFTYQMIEDPANNFSQGSTVREAVDTVTMVDDLTFTLTFTDPKPFPEDIAGSPGLSQILPAHIFRPIYEAEGSIEFADENQDPTVFSGPYVLTEWRRGADELRPEPELRAGSAVDSERCDPLLPGHGLGICGAGGWSA